MKKILSGCLLIFVFAFKSYATDYYVSALIGSNSYNGISPLTPYATLQYASDRTNAGDNVYIMNGTYNTSNGTILKIARSGNNTQSITYKAYTGHFPKITATGNVWNMIEINANYIVFDGIEMQGNNDNITYANAKKAYDDYIKPLSDPTRVPPQAFYNTNCMTIAATGNYHHITVRNCKVHDFSAGGIGVSTADYVTIENNIVYNNSWYTMYATSGISVLTPYSYDTFIGYKIFIRNNICYNNKTLVPWEQIRALSDGNGIIIDVNIPTSTYSGYNGKTWVENNVCYNNGGGGVHAYKASNVNIINNTAYNNGTVVGYPEIDGQQGANVSITNNIMYARNGGNCNTNDNTATYNYNLYYNGPAFLQGPYDIVANPQFVNLALDGTANFSLKNNSPAINTGSNINGQYSSNDILGVSRPVGAKPDRGAYEFSGTPNTQNSFISGNISVLRVGDGITSLNTNATSVNILEYNLNGNPSGINLTIGNENSTSQNRLLLSGDASNLDGQLNLSNDGRFLTLTGYETNINDVQAIYKANEKVIARVNYLGEPDYTTRISSNTNNGTVRSAVSSDGSRFYFTGSTTSPASANSTRFLSYASGTNITSTAFNTGVRSLAIFKDQVYYVNGNVVGSLTPNPGANNFAANVTFPGVNISGHNYQSLALIDLDATASYLSTGYDVLYCADASLGLVKFYWSGSTWVLAGSFNPTVSGVTGGLYALTARLNASGKAEIFAVKGTASNNVIVALTDEASFTGSISTTNPTFTNIASAGANYLFKGVAFSPSQFSTLPIELTEFKAQLSGKEVILNWSTSSEINAKEFIIERTTDGKTFIEIGKVNSKNKSTGATYMFHDVQLPIGYIYYRLKSVDFDGSYKLSHIVSVKNSNEVKSNISISPVPVIDKVEISHPLTNLNAELSIVDSRGVNIKTYKLLPNSTVTKINLSDLVSGIYVLTFINEGKLSVTKFIK
ncbi:choice-of-anchor Q domain-containing protein [Pedobacter psychrophilus]|uniref:choice-of-anchor Q domain-containing protein n=1 Tax=Pedobacter psychrophilus TaxID=1826909 RepID=UPI00083A7641|nr:choice-of-anchor Q domain-containing protein [Pedobacter psychrophilus]